MQTTNIQFQSQQIAQDPKSNQMFVHMTKQRLSPPPRDDRALNIRDMYYGTDPHQIRPFEERPPPARWFADLNQDVMTATNEGGPDAPEKGQEQSRPLPNCYTPNEVLTKSRQERLFRDEVTKITSVDLLNESQLARFRQETSHLESISHPDVVHSIMMRIFSPSVIVTISNAFNDLPIRGKFFLHLDEMGRTYFDWTNMSMHHLHLFLDIIKALTSPGSNETDAQKTESAMRVSMNVLLDATLSDLDSVLQFATLETKCTDNWTNNFRLRSLLPKNDTDIATKACQYLESFKTSAPRFKRAGYFLELLRAEGIYHPGGTCTGSFESLINHLQSYLEQTKNNWTIVKRFITSAQAEILHFSHEEVSEAIQLVKSGAAANAISHKTDKRGNM